MKRTLHSTPRLLLAFVMLVEGAALGTACGAKIAPTEAEPTDASADARRDTSSDARIDVATDAGPDVIVDDFDAGLDQDAVAPIVETDLGGLESHTPTSFTIAKNTLGFQIVATASGIQSVGIETVSAPNGVLAVNEFIPAKGFYPGAFGYEGIAAVSVPMQNLPETMPVVAPGVWQLTVANDDGSPIPTKVRSLVTDDGKFHGGVLDVHLWIPTGLQMFDGDQIATVDVNRGPAQPAVQRRMDAFYQSVERLTGIRRGTVTLHSLSSEYVTLDGEDGALELTPMLQSSTAVSNPRSMHFFWVQTTDDLSWWGTASGLPGAASSTGTPLAGVTLATIPAADPAEEGVVMFHEMGHFVGLHHLVEFNEAGNDPLEDTPLCPGMDFNNYEQCPGANNVMAAAGGLDKDGAELSPLQTHILRSSLVYTALARGPAPAPPGPRTPTRSLRTPFRGWVAKTPLARSLAGGCAEQALPTRASLNTAQIAELEVLATSPTAPSFVRVRAARILR